MVSNYTSELEVSKIIGSLKNKTSSGHDGISNEILKCCSPIIEKYLVRRFIDCAEKQVFPECLKIAKVLPFFKKGDDSLPSKYRPISLQCSLSKFPKNSCTNEWSSFSTKTIYLPPCSMASEKIFMRSCDSRSH